MKALHKWIAVAVSAGMILSTPAAYAQTGETNSPAPEVSVPAEDKEALQNSVLLPGMTFDGDAEGDEMAGTFAPPAETVISADVQAKGEISQTAYLKKLLEKVGKGYSQSLRNHPDYYDCSSLVDRCYRELGITNIPYVTSAWNSLLAGKKVGDIVTFSGPGGYVRYRLTATNLHQYEHPELFEVPGTLIIMIEPGESSGHIAVSLGAFDRAGAAYDPATQAENIIYETCKSVQEQLTAAYGVPEATLWGINPFSGSSKFWMHMGYLGTDMVYDGKTSGDYHPIWRVEAFRPEYGVCISNTPVGVVRTWVRYVLQPITEENVKKTEPQILSAEASDITEKGYQVSVKFSVPEGVDKVLFPTWTEKDGQDDLVWHQAQPEGDTARFYVETAAHKGEIGQYITHIYVYDKLGRYAVKGVNVQVPAEEPAEEPEEPTEGPEDPAEEPEEPTEEPEEPTEEPEAPEEPEQPGPDPCITELTVSEVSSEGYRVNIRYRASAGVSKILFPTWTEKNGQDDLIWYTAQANGNTASVYVRSSEHGQESGSYLTHVYVYDKNGVYALRGTSVTVPKKSQQPGTPSDQEPLRIKEATAAEITENGYRVNVTLTGSTAVRVLFPTWTEKNGQDDLVWHEGTLNGNTATCMIPKSAHRGESGAYITHVYVYGADQKPLAPAGVNVMVPSAVPDAAPEITEVSVSDVSSLGYTVTVHYKAPAGVQRVTLPTWTEKNGQDDIVWYEAAAGNGSTSIRVQTGKHRNEHGTYLTHVYVYDKKGRYAIKGIYVTIP